MKKVLFITVQNHNYAGGIEFYSYNLMKIMHEIGYEVYEYSTCVNIQNKVRDRLPYVHNISVDRKIALSEYDAKGIYGNSLWARLKGGIGDFKALKFQKKHLPSIVKNYDLVIDNSTFEAALSDRDHPRIIWIQHFDFKHYKWFKVIGRSMLKILIRINFPYKIYRRKVLFSSYSEKCYKKLFKKDAAKTVFYLNNLCVDKNTTSNLNAFEKFNKPVVWLGRAQELKAKRIDFANRVAKYVNRPILVYGLYKPSFISKYKFLQFSGCYSAKDLDRIYEGSSLTLITSDIEGLPYVAVESILHNNPLILRNTFVESNFLVSNTNGFLFNKKDSPLKIANFINTLLNDFDEYQKFYENTKSFQNTFDINNFKKKWIKIITQVQNEK